jgi:hypothetical protein
VNAVASSAVLLAGVYLMALAAVALLAPQRAKRFLARFASSASAHFLELSVRLLIGAALVIYAQQMKFTLVFVVFGWVVIITTLILFSTPWRWHQRFAVWSVPLATRNMALFGIGSLAGGSFLLLSVLYGPGFGR